MISNILLRSQKNEILNLLEQADFRSVSFEWVKIESNYFENSMVSRLNYINTDFFYTFDISGEAHYAVYSPAKNSYLGTDYPCIWSKQKASFINWLHNIKKENNEPDLWKEVSSSTYRNQSYLATPSQNSPDHNAMLGKIDQLLDDSKTEKKYNKDKSAFIIKRYYGKV